MSTEWKAKRFWTEARPVAEGAGWRIELDGRVLRTPLKSALVLPTRALADAVANEWNAQGEVIAPLTMPATRAANAAVDKVAPQRAEVIEMLEGYGGTDLTCYRAEGPQSLIDAEAAAWDPLLDWAEARFGARLTRTHGVVPVAQDAGAIRRLAQPLREADDFALTAIYDLVTLSGSLVIGLAVAENHLSAEKGWALSRTDETWQESQWGEDADAAEASAAKLTQFVNARKLLTYLHKD